MILTYLDLSTSHVTEKTMKQLVLLGATGELGTSDLSSDRLSMAGWPAMTIANYDHGVFLSVPGLASPDQYEQIPADLRRVIEHAESLEVTLVRLDADGDILEALPTYDW